jgi:hypothetical protein
VGAGQTRTQRVNFLREPGVVFGGFGLLAAKPCHHLHEQFDFVFEPIDWIEIGRTRRRLLCHP